MSDLEKRVWTFVELTFLSDGWRQHGDRRISVFSHRFDVD